MTTRRPRREYVYLMGSPDSPIVKIGRSNNPTRRLAQVQETVEMPLQLMWQTPGGKEMELGLHGHFASQRRHGEWFELGFAEAPNLVAAAVASNTWETESFTMWRPRSTNCTACGHTAKQHGQDHLCNVFWGWNPDTSERCGCAGYTLRRASKLLPIPAAAEMFVPSAPGAADLAFAVSYGRAS